MTLGKEKLHFLNSPTPLHRLDRISEDLGLELWIKRDDLTNFGAGGNKLRKLEYFVQDAKSRGATMLLTVGGPQTNHGRLTAAMAARYGMRSAIVAVSERPDEISANLLLDGIMGCHVYLAAPVPGISAGQVQQDAVRKVTEEWEAAGEKVYYIPMGGSNELGALGYYDCAMEIAGQVRELSEGGCGPFPEGRPRIISTVGSMGTYIGLATAIANEGLPMSLTGISIMPGKDRLGEACDYYGRLLAAYGDQGLTAKLSREDFDIRLEFDYGAYNNPVKDVRDAIRYMGSKEAILLDPCYTGKTFNAILKMAEAGELRKEEPVIFLHTGGFPGLYTSEHRVEFEKELAEYYHFV